MARKSKNQDENMTQNTMVENTAVETAPVTQKIIVAKKIKNGRWYVYFLGVKPEENVGCGCKTARSAIRYMYLLKNTHGAKISENIYERLKMEMAQEKEA